MRKPALNLAAHACYSQRTERPPIGFGDIGGWEADPDFSTAIPVENLALEGSLWMVRSLTENRAEVQAMANGGVSRGAKFRLKALRPMIFLEVLIYFYILG
jgi:hypothetical protein